MPKVASEHLFQLIRTLGQAEKAYFSRYMKMSGKKTESSLGVQLFNLIEEQKNYDEKKIVQKLNNLSPGHFSFLKNQLYQQVMSALKLYHASLSPEFIVKGLLQEADILIEKQLYNLALSVLNKAEKIAIRNEIFPDLLQIFLRKLDSITFSTGTDALKTFVLKEKGFLNAEKTLKQQANWFQLLEQQSAIALITNRKQKFQNPEDKVKMQKIIKSLLSIDVNSLLSERSTTTFYLLLMNAHEFIYNPTKALVYSKKLVEHMESSPYLLLQKQGVFLYIRALYELTKFYGQLQKYGEVLKVVEKGKKYYDEYPKLHSKRSDILVYALYYDKYFLYCFDIGDFDKAYAAINERTKALNSLPEIRQDWLMIFYYHAFYACFGVSNYERANFYINKILNIKDKKSRDDIYMSAEIASVIIAFEFTDYDLLERRVRTLKRKLEQEENTYLLENTTLPLMQNILKAKNKKEEIQLFISFKKELKQLSKKEVDIYKPFNYWAWLESKIENKPFADIVKKH